MGKSYKKLPHLFQDIVFFISNFKFNYLPLKYNVKLFFENDEQIKKKE